MTHWPQLSRIPCVRRRQLARLLRMRVLERRWRHRTQLLRRLGISKWSHYTEEEAIEMAEAEDTRKAAGRAAHQQQHEAAGKRTAALARVEDLILGNRCPNCKQQLSEHAAFTLGDRAIQLVCPLVKVEATEPPTRGTREDFINRLRARRTRLNEYLCAGHSHPFNEQMHLQADSIERDYWHHGYMVALGDVLAMFQDASCELPEALNGTATPGQVKRNAHAQGVTETGAQHQVQPEAGRSEREAAAYDNLQNLPRHLVPPSEGAARAACQVGPSTHTGECRNYYNSTLPRHRALHSDQCGKLTKDGKLCLRLAVHEEHWPVVERVSLGGAASFADSGHERTARLLAEDARNRVQHFAYESSIARLLREVLAIRLRQDEKHGGPEHDRLHPRGDWSTLIEIEASRARLKCPADAPTANMQWRHHMLSVAALALAAVEAQFRIEEAAD